MNSEYTCADDGWHSPVAPLLAPCLDAVFREASLLDHASAWFGHIPFARWIVAALKPECLVELGTHDGVSYNAFCSAVQIEDLSTSCHAVDTWQGDAQAGFYSDEIYKRLLKYNDDNFSGFSVLHRTEFDNALKYFKDGSIDLLHIDGFHSYEAVSHDFHTWFEKMSDRGIVLFHDTNERREGFGVWKFWSEISTRFPSFQFLHSHGLGVLCVGKNTPRALTELCGLNEIEAEKLRNRFRIVGERWAVDASRRKEKETYIHERKTLESKLVALEGAKEELVRKYDKNFVDLQEKLSAISHVLEECQHQSLNYQIENAFWKAQAESIRDRYESSISWRVTWVFRKISHSFFRKEKEKRNYIFSVLERISFLRSHSLYDGELDVMNVLKNSELFDETWYLEQYPDVKLSAMDPVEHYLYYGASEGRNPSRHFNTKLYFYKNSDVKKSGMNPLYHFIKHGKGE
ncbi:MAG: class I SAM-dependent methyltransferase [Candidatus Ochrobactrum gambitense]|nr:MAG: class I SAM-dependent methyltransferase [Candidatus Ochrobactrum gambitense]WEK16967.1 MAG: class I SAM-dependent methyltransferase [Candidatus Ochrobactrum gambitense]